MSIVRVQKRETPYVVIDKTILDDPALSFKAKGIAAYLLGKPDGWRIHIRQLASVCADGEAAVRTGMQELEKAGYLRRERRQDEQGRFTWESVLYETPHVEKPHVEKPCVENPRVDKPHVENRSLVNKEVVNKEVVSNEVVSNEERERERVPDRAPTTSPPPPPRPGLHEQVQLDPRKIQNGLIPPGQGSSPAEVYREFFDYRPSRTQLQTMNREVTDLAQWRKVLNAWCLSGYRSNNFRGMLDWYQKGIPQHKHKEQSNGQHRKPRPTEGWTPDLIGDQTLDTSDEARALLRAELERRAELGLGVRPLPKRAHQSAGN